MMRGQLSSVCILASFILVSSNASDSETESALINVAKVDGLKLNLNMVQEQDILTGPKNIAMAMVKGPYPVPGCGRYEYGALAASGTRWCESKDLRSWLETKKCWEAVQKYVFTGKSNEVRITGKSQQRFKEYGPKTMLYLTKAVDILNDEYRTMYPTWSTLFSRSKVNPFLKVKRSESQPVTVDSSTVDVLDGKVPVAVVDGVLESCKDDPNLIQQRV